MASLEEQQNERAVFNNEDDDDDSDESDDDVTDDDTPSNPNPNPPNPTDPQPPQQPPADPASNPNGPNNPNPSPNGPPTTPIMAITAVSVEDRRPLAFSAYDESRRLFQRLWTDDDEIKILQGFYDFTSKRGTTFASHQYDTGPFYEDIKKQLNLEFTKNQLIEKLRRLKKKYRNCVNRMRSLGKDFSFKSAHERAVYDIAKNIWSASVKRSRDSDDDDVNVNANDVVSVPISEGSLGVDKKGVGSKKRLRRKMAEEAAAAAAAASIPAVAHENSVPGIPGIPTPLQAVAGVPNVIEETVKSCLSPLFKELISSAIATPFSSGSGIGGMTSLNMLPLGLGSAPVPTSGGEVDEKWKKQQILELQVYLKRIELVRDHVMATLEELKSSDC